MQGEQEYKLVWESDDPAFLNRLKKNQCKRWLKSKTLRIAAVILAVVVLAGVLWLSFGERPTLSEMSVEQCIRFLRWNGIEFPDGKTTEYWGEWALSIIRRCEEDPNYLPGVSSTQLFVFSEDIREAVNDYYGITDARPAMEFDGV